MELADLIPQYGPDLNLDQLNRENLLAAAVASKKAVFDLLLERKYPVYKFFTGGEDVLSDAIAGDRIETFEWDREKNLYRAVSKGVTEDNPMVLLTASTNAVDMAGDIMEEAALRDMLGQAKGTTVFLNHKYTLPEDVFGYVEDAEIVQRKLTNPLTKETANYLCLDYRVAPVSKEENPRAWGTYQMIRRGKTRMGASVTVLLLDKSDRPDGRRSINKVYYIETSLVSVPCNQLSWVQRVAKALEPKKHFTAPAAPIHTEQKVMKDQQLETAAPAVTETEETAIVSKGLYADKVQQRQSRFYFMVDVLSDVISDLKMAAQNKVTMDYEAELNTALEEFTTAVKTAVMPMLTAPAQNAMSYYSVFSPEDAQQVVDGLITKMVGELGKDAELVTKAGARNNKKDAERIQKMHNHCVSLGATCSKSDDADADSKAAPIASATTGESTPATPEVNVGEFETKIASLTETVTSKEAEVKTLEQKVANLQNLSSRWIALSWFAVSCLDKVLDQPLPRAGRG
jgi:hypothetical protein